MFQPFRSWRFRQVIYFGKDLKKKTIKSIYLILFIFVIIHKVWCTNFLPPSQLHSKNVPPLNKYIYNKGFHLKAKFRFVLFTILKSYTIFAFIVIYNSVNIY